jgi:alkyl sulfatase BDS1-like metallo-beta-lactamase superfamily hydrolase
MTSKDTRATIAQQQAAMKERWPFDDTRDFEDGDRRSGRRRR